MTKDISYITDRELLERIYAGQLRMQMDIELIWNNLKMLHERLNPDAFDLTNENYSNPTAWRHYLEIHKDFVNAHEQFKKDLQAKVIDENKGNVAAW